MSSRIAQNLTTPRGHGRRDGETKQVNLSTLLVSCASVKGTKAPANILIHKLILIMCAFLLCLTPIIMIITSLLLTTTIIIIMMVIKVIHMLILIMAVFFLCWTPILTYNLLAAFELMGQVTPSQVLQPLLLVGFINSDLSSMSLDLVT